jgi:hypothetical protein
MARVASSLTSAMNAMCTNMAGAHVRPTPHYKFIAWSGLSERAKCRLEANSTDIPAGLLRCRLADGGEPVLLNRSSAIPWIEGSLQLTPNLPPWLLREIAGLVLDAALHIETKNGTYTGPSAFEPIFGSGRVAHPEGQIGRLSVSALQHASQLENAGIHDVTASLYFFNRLPAAPSLHARFPSPEAVQRFLDTDCVMRCPKTASAWQLRSSGPDWLFWHRRGYAQRPPSAQRYKLYVSAHFESLPAILAKAPELLAEAGARAFKIGGTVHGMVRPDNFVAYMPSLKSVETAAALIREELSHVRARALPFTVQLGADGLTSWGLDPRRGTASWHQGQSWRLWICQQLARAIVVARKLPESGIAPCEYAMLRLLPAGVSPDKWRPSHDFDNWQEGRAAA